MITVFSKASLPMERGVGRIYSQSRGRGHRKFFWGLRPQTPSGSPLLFSPLIQKCAPRSLGLLYPFQSHVTKLLGSFSIILLFAFMVQLGMARNMLEKSTGVLSRD